MGRIICPVPFYHSCLLPPRGLQVHLVQVLLLRANMPWTVILAELLHHRKSTLCDLSIPRAQRGHIQYCPVWGWGTASKIEHHFVIALAWTVALKFKRSLAGGGRDGPDLSLSHANRSGIPSRKLGVKADLRVPIRVCSVPLTILATFLCDCKLCNYSFNDLIISCPWSVCSIFYQAGFHTVIDYITCKSNTVNNVP